MHVPIEEDGRLLVLPALPPEVNPLKRPSLEGLARDDELRVLREHGLQIGPVLDVVRVRMVRVEPVQVREGAFRVMFTLALALSIVLPTRALALASEVGPEIMAQHRAVLALRRLKGRDLMRRDSEVHGPDAVVSAPTPELDAGEVIDGRLGDGDAVDFVPVVADLVANRPVDRSRQAQGREGEEKGQGPHVFLLLSALLSIRSTNTNASRRNERLNRNIVREPSHGRNPDKSPRGLLAFSISPSLQCPPASRRLYTKRSPRLKRMNPLSTYPTPRPPHPSIHIYLSICK